MTYTVSPTCQIQFLGDIYKSVFGDDYIGTFVEVGAYDGITYSNTYGLAVMGWCGICVEPFSESYNKCMNTHLLHSISVRRAFISDKKGKTKIYVKDWSSTIEEDFARAQGMLAGPTEEVDTLTLDELLTEHNIRNGFEVLSIDVEGHELSVLNGFDISRWKPVMCIVEAHEFSKNPLLNRQAAGIIAYFVQHDYEKIYSDAINSIFLHKFSDTK